MMTPMRKFGSSAYVGLLAVATTALTLSMAAPALAQTWPSEPVHIIVPFSPGGSTDLLARVAAEALSQALGQPFVVESRPGASGTIGSLEVANATPDGNTLLFATVSTHAVAPAVGSELPYDIEEDFTPIALVGEANMLLLASPSLEAQSVEDLISLAQGQPELLNYTTSGAGTVTHLMFEMMMEQTDTQLTHIPYSGTGSAIQDLMSGAVHLSWDALPTGMAHLADGKIRALAVSGGKRSAYAADIPTLAETVAPDFDVMTWFGLFAPGEMSTELQEEINQKIVAVLQQPATVARLEDLRIEFTDRFGGSAQDFAEMVELSREQWRSLASSRNIQVD